MTQIHQSIILISKPHTSQIHCYKTESRNYSLDSNSNKSQITGLASAPERNKRTRKRKNKLMRNVLVVDGVDSPSCSGRGCSSGCRGPTTPPMRARPQTHLRGQALPAARAASRPWSSLSGRREEEAEFPLADELEWRGRGGIAGGGGLSLGEG